jgi:serine/threonine protein kinase
MPDVPGVSADIQRLIHACLALNPEDRPTAEQLALSARQKQFPIKSRKPLYITLVVIALLLVGGLSFFLGGNVVEQTEIPKVPVEEVYQTALHRMDSQNIDSLKSGLRMMDSLSSTNYIPAIYQMAFTYGCYYVQELVDKGELIAEEAYLHPDSNLITRALGDDSCNNEPDVISSRLEPGELLLLCSDGLCGYCPDESIEQVLRAHYTDAEQCCDQLLSLALDAGGYDNICIAVVSLIGDDQDAPVAISPVRRFWYAVREVLHL